MATILPVGGLVGARLLGALANVLVLWLLARALPAADVGIILTVQSACLLAGLFLTANQESLSIRIIPQHRTRHSLRLLTKAILTSSAIMAPPVFIALTLILMLALDGFTATPGMLVVIFLIALFSTVLTVSSKLAHALGQTVTSGMTVMTVRPALWAVVILVLSVSGSLSIGVALTSSAFAFLIAALGQLALLWSAIPKTPHHDDDAALEPSAWWKQGAALSPSVLFVDHFANLATLLAAVLLDDADIAIFAVTLRLAMLLRMLNASTTRVVGPALSAGLSSSTPERAIRSARPLLRLNFFGVAAAALVLMVIGPWALEFFGEGYGAGWPQLMVLLLWPITAAFLGPSLLALIALGESGVITRFAAIALTTMIVAAFVGQLAGGIGVVIGLVAGSLVWEALLFRQTRQRGISLWFPANQTPPAP